MFGKKKKQNLLVLKKEDLKHQSMTIRERFIIPDLRYASMKQLIKEHALELFKEHIGHTLEFQEDSPHILWIHCLNCNKLWTHCDLCLYSGRNGLLDFDCEKKSYCYKNFNK